MKKILSTATLLLVLTLILTSCGQKNNESMNKDGKLQVVSSFTIITDMVEQIGGEQVEVYNLVPTGTDPHEYEPLPEDIKKASDADVLFYNGMNLEGGEDGWFIKMVHSVNQNMDKVFDLNEGVSPKFLTSSEGKEEQVNPHSYLDPKVGIKMVENLSQALINVDPNNESYYKENTEAYLERLKGIDNRYKEVVESIPQEHRFLVTSERAFQYMTESYGLKEAFVWAIDTEDSGTAEQIRNLVNTLRENPVPVLFLESNVDERPLETVSQETGIPIFEKSIYSDEIGEKGSEVDTYMKLLEYNIEIIEEGLKGN